MSARSTAARLWIAIEDRLIPALRLTTHERALYYHLLRRTRLVGRRAVRVSRRKLAAVLGLSTYTARHYLRVLARKNCLRFLDRGSSGCLITVLLPDEIASSLPASFMEGSAASNQLALLTHRPPIALDAAGQPRAWPRTDHFRNEAFREKILKRDRGRCFYCRRALGVPSIPSVAEGRVPYVPPIPLALRNIEGSGAEGRKAEGHPGQWSLDHVLPIARGGLDVASNLVACCTPCNFEKALTPADEFLRTLRRTKILSSAQLRSRLSRLRSL